MHNKNLCRVCGLFHEDAPWGEDGKTPTFNICECCGVEFGYEDATPEATDKFREAWIKRGCPWFSKAKKPNNWDLPVQLAQVQKQAKAKGGKGVKK